MIKKLALVLAVVAVGSLVAGCGFKAPSSANKSAFEKSAEADAAARNAKKK